MLAVIIINVLLIAFVLVAIVGSHLWAIRSSREPQPSAVSPARAPIRRRRLRTARALRGATATR